MTAWELVHLFWLMALAHFVADYVFQNDVMAVQKGPRTNDHPAVPWPYWMAAHCATHALAVSLITGSVLLGVLELIVHFGQDLAKCLGKLALLQDQLLHLAWKAVWVLIACAWAWGLRTAVP